MIKCITEKRYKMKKIKSLLIAFLIAAAPCLSGSTEAVEAATKEDVIAAARAAGFSESYVQQGINYLESGSFTPEQYDVMVAELNRYAGRADEAIRDYLGESNPTPPESAPSEGNGTVPDAGNNAAPDSGNNVVPDSGNNASPDVENGNSGAPVVPESSASENTGSTGNAVAPEKDFSSLTDEEKDKYIAGLTSEEKNHIIKDLDRETQLEIINSLIDAGSSLGFNISVDSLTKDKIEYSIRNDQGDVVDIASMGVIVDDTGIDYTFLILAAFGLILLSAGGITVMAFYNKRGSQER